MTVMKEHEGNGKEHGTQGIRGSYTLNPKLDLKEGPAI